MKLLIIILAIIILYFFYYSEYNYKKICNFNIHRTSNIDSAKTLKEVNKRIEILKAYLATKYSCSTCTSDVIDTIRQYNMDERIKQLYKNYNKKNIYEISPNNLMGSTSFTKNKTKLTLCLRSKEGKIHDINTVMFVVIHEVAHMMNDQFGHELRFWQLFQVLLKDSVECGIYIPVDYKLHPVKYCGLSIDQSPLFTG